MYELCLLAVCLRCVAASWLIRLTCFRPLLGLDKPSREWLPGVIRAGWLPLSTTGLCTCFFCSINQHYGFLLLLHVASFIPSFLLKINKILLRFPNCVLYGSIKKKRVSDCKQVQNIHCKWMLASEQAERVHWVVNQPQLVLPPTAPPLHHPLPPNPHHQCYESLLSGAQSTILAAYVAARSGFSRLVNVVIHGTQAHTLKASVVCRVKVLLVRLMENYRSENCKHASTRAWIKHTKKKKKPHIGN